MESKSEATIHDGIVRKDEGEVGKRAYVTPELIQWGTILDLTQGGLNGIEDGDFSGTQPT